MPPTCMIGRIHGKGYAKSLLLCTCSQQPPWQILGYVLQGKCSAGVHSLDLHAVYAAACMWPLWVPSELPFVHEVSSNRQNAKRQSSGPGIRQHAEGKRGQKKQSALGSAKHQVPAPVVDEQLLAGRGPLVW